MTQEELTKIITWIILILVAYIVYLVIRTIYRIIKNIIYGIINISTKKQNKWDDLEKTILHTKVSAGIPSREFIPDKIYLNDFNHNPYNIENLQNITKDILNHCGYKGPEPHIQYGLTGKEIATDTINEYRCYITINSEPRKMPQVLYAIIIHECMKLLIFYSDIQYGQVNTEMPAEVMAVYKGFYRYTRDYSPYMTTNKLKYIYKKIYK